LLRHWPRLVEWVKRDRSFQSWLAQIRANLTLWSANRADGAPLLRGGMLAQGDEWFAKRQEDLSPTERDYIEASLEMRRREEREKAEAIETELRRQMELAEAANKLAVEQRRRVRGARLLTFFALYAGALAGYGWWATAGLLKQQTEAAISTAEQGLSERWADGRLPALVVTIEDRLAQTDDGAIYLLVDPAMKRVAGNLASWPSSATTVGHWYELPVMRAGMKSLAAVQRYELPGGFHLLIGRDVQVRATLNKMMINALLWFPIVVIIMVAVASW
jgi:hypothetical protein